MQIKVGQRYYNPKEHKFFEIRSIDYRKKMVTCGTACDYWSDAHTVIYSLNEKHTFTYLKRCQLITVYAISRMFKHDSIGYNGKNKLMSSLWVYNGKDKLQIGDEIQKYNNWETVGKIDDAGDPKLSDTLWWYRGDLRGCKIRRKVMSEYQNIKNSIKTITGWDEFCDDLLETIDAPYELIIPACKFADIPAYGAYKLPCIDVIEKCTVSVVRVAYFQYRNHR